MKRRSISLIAIVSILIISLSVPSLADKMPEWLYEEYFGKRKSVKNYNDTLGYAKELKLGEEVVATQEEGKIKNWYYFDVDESCFYRVIFEGLDPEINYYVYDEYEAKIEDKPNGYGKYIASSHGLYKAGLDYFDVLLGQAASKYEAKNKSRYYILVSSDLQDEQEYSIFVQKKETIAPHTETEINDYFTTGYVTDTIEVGQKYSGTMHVQPNVPRSYDIDCYKVNTKKTGKYIFKFDDFQEKYAETVLDIIWDYPSSGDNLANMMRKSGENYCYVNLDRQCVENFAVLGLNDGSEYTFEIDFVE